MRLFRSHFAALFAAVFLFLAGGERADARGKRNSSGASGPAVTGGAVGAPVVGDNQKDMCMNSYKLDAVGSDESLKNSTVYAMQALMDLSNLHLTNAMKEGYNAYGKYRNAENLDNLKDKSALCANSLGSVGSAPVLPTTRTDTTFRRLDPSFLNQGEAAKIAAEFERQTGMKRADFLTEMAKVSEQKIKRSDPAMIDKALSRFEGFLQKIPNQEFKRNAEKAIAMVPDTLRRGMVAQAVQKLAGMFTADAPAGAPALDSTIATLDKDRFPASNPNDKTAPSVAVTGAGDGSGGKGEAARDPAATGAEKPAPQPAGGNGSRGFDGVVAAALLESKLETKGAGEAPAEETIFAQVTKRYRILTPELLKAP